eukprot:2804597-Alexandrium_andersonii.AAC.1
MCLPGHRIVCVHACVQICVHCSARCSRNFGDIGEDIPVIALLQHLLSCGWTLSDDEPLAHTAATPKLIAPA